MSCFENFLNSWLSTWSDCSRYTNCTRPPVFNFKKLISALRLFGTFVQNWCIPWRLNCSQRIDYNICWEIRSRYRFRSEAGCTLEPVNPAVGPANYSQRHTHRPAEGWSKWFFQRRTGHTWDPRWWTPVAPCKQCLVSKYINTWACWWTFFGGPWDPVCRQLPTKISFCYFC